MKALNLKRLKKDLIKIENILKDIELIESFNIDIKFDLTVVEKQIRKKRNNLKLDTNVKNAILLLRVSEKRVSIRSIAKLVNKENSIRSVWLSIKRQGLKITFN